MKFIETKLKGSYIIEPNVFEDERGYFFESFSQKKFIEGLGQKIDFVQDNQSMSNKGVLRGLHFQKGENAQAKLVRVVSGSVLDVCVDLREGSETFGDYFSIVLDSIRHNQLYVPRGFAHGFLVLENNTVFSYKCDNFYDKASEGGIIYNDPQINIDWHLKEEQLMLSDKDKILPTLQNYLAGS